jgi:DNA-binding transcriptional MerR regulator
MPTMMKTRNKPRAARPGPKPVSVSGDVAGIETIPDKTFFRIGEVARLLGVKPYVLRFWETEFPMLVPQKSAKNHRVYRRAEIESLFLVRHLLYEQKYSIEGARRYLRGRKPPSAAQATRARELAAELARLARTPIARLFHL